MRVRIGGHFDRLSDCGFRYRCRNPLAERVVVVGLEDGAGVAVDDGADAAEVVAEVDQGSVGDRSVVGGLADYPAGGGQGAVEGQGRRTGLTRGLGVDQGASVLEAVPGAVCRADLRAVGEMSVLREGGVSGGDAACQVEVIVPDVEAGQAVPCQIAVGVVGVCTPAAGRAGVADADKHIAVVGICQRVLRDSRVRPVPGERQDVAVSVIGDGSLAEGVGGHASRESPCARQASYSVVGQ